ncbi:hypothetical protein BU17DRAFT_60295 [Hysterangium stoloniferum]|nr:hypothetical protein BU17DRAFT_60295 [Hysterangium stoloniferum]
MSKLVAISIGFIARMWRRVIGCSSFWEAIAGLDNVIGSIFNGTFDSGYDMHLKMWLLITFVYFVVSRYLHMIMTCHSINGQNDEVVIFTQPGYSMEPTGDFQVVVIT